MMTTLIGTGIVIGSLIGAVILWYLIGCVILWEKPFKHEEYHIETGPKIFMGFFITALLSLLIFIHLISVRCLGKIKMGFRKKR